MIVTTAAFDAKHDQLVKKPIIALEIENYRRVFTTIDDEESSPYWTPRETDQNGFFSQSGSFIEPTSGKLLWVSDTRSTGSWEDGNFLLFNTITVVNPDRTVEYIETEAMDGAGGLIPVSGLNCSVIMADADYIYISIETGAAAWAYYRVAWDGTIHGRCPIDFDTLSAPSDTVITGDYIFHVNGGGIFKINRVAFSMGSGGTAHYDYAGGQRCCAWDGTYLWVLGIPNPIGDHGPAYVTRYNPADNSVSSWQVGSATNCPNIYTLKYDAATGCLFAWIQDGTTGDTIIKWDPATHASVDTLAKTWAGTGPIRDGKFIAGLEIINTSDLSTFLTLTTQDFNPELPGLKFDSFAIQWDPVNSNFWAMGQDTNVYLALVGIFNEHYPWINAMSDINFNVDELNAQTSIDNVTFSVTDINHALTEDMASVTLEGRRCWIRCGYPGLNYDDWVILFSGRVDNIPETPGAVNTSYDFIMKDLRTDLQQVIYIVGDNGLPTSSDNPRTLLGNPIDILLNVLLVELNIEPELVDVSAWHAYRDLVFDGLEVQFSIDSPPDGKTWLENEILKPLGGYMRTNNLGVIKPVFFTPLPGAASALDTLDHDSLTTSSSGNSGAGSGVPELGQQPLSNVISFRYDSDGNAFGSETVILYRKSIDKYSQQGQIVIESAGLRSALQGWLQAQITGNAIFGRYGFKNPTADVVVLWKKLRLEAGDLLYVTSALVPNRETGMLGITDHLFQVSSRFLHLSGEFTAEFVLVDASYMLGYGNFKYAEDGTLDWTLADSGTKNARMFISDDTGHYSDSTPGHTTA